MPVAPGIMASTAESRFGAMPQIHSSKEAAAAFEGLLLKQLFGEMSKTVGESGMFGGGFEGNLYSDMFVDALAGEASKGGIGLSKMFEDALGIEEHAAPAPASPIAAMASRVRAMSAYRIESEGPVLPPANGGLASVVGQWLDGPAALRWGKDGALTPADLSADISTNGRDGTAVFNVLDANGYEGYPKCNLFSLELLRRAGYAVPVQARGHGWGYPGAGAVTSAAESGDAQNWAVSRTQATGQELSQISGSGTPLLLAGAGTDEIMGHMAVADQIHAVQRDQAGNIVSVEYSGWEAGGSKASYGRRTWHLAGVPGPGRGGLSHIEILEPRLAQDTSTYHSIDGALPGRSIHDLETHGLTQASFSSTDDNRRGNVANEPQAGGKHRED